MNAPREPLALAATDPLAARAERRARWMRRFVSWHWVSSALCMVCMLFFAATGVLLNNPGLFEGGRAATVQHDAHLPAPVMAAINAPRVAGAADDTTVPPALRDWVRTNWQLTLYPKAVEWRDDELFIDLKRPGVDAWLSVDRQRGTVEYQLEDHGWVAFFNDLHKGKNAGPVWNVFITVFGVGCVVFALTGLGLLALHSRARAAVWPVTVFGLLLPLILILLHVR